MLEEVSKDAPILYGIETLLDACAEKPDSTHDSGQLGGVDELGDYVEECQDDHRGDVVARGP